MNTHGFELKSFGLEIVNDLPGYWTGLQFLRFGGLEQELWLLKVT